MRATKRKWISTSGRLLLGALVASASFILSTPSQAAALMAGTKHNLSTSGTGSVVSSGTDEICVFCHTPHGSNTTTNGVAPLWNRAVRDAGTYTAYGTTGLDQTGAVGSVSLACLSCHDGQAAIDAAINTPGSGSTGTEASPARIGTVNAVANRVTAGGVLDANNIAMLGTSLANDHPIGVRYCASTAAAGTNTCSDTTAYNQVSKDGSRALWFVETSGGAASRDKTDMILYTQNNMAYVECASCHDPHSSNPLFLRMANGNTESQVCLACHVK